MLKLVKNLIAVLCLLMLAFLIAYVYLWLDLNPTVDVRTGYLQKLSKKGFLCKTWEGELVTDLMSPGESAKFFFSVRDEAVVKQLHGQMGSFVNLQYQVHHGTMFFGCLGDTQHFVTEVTKRP